MGKEVDDGVGGGGSDSGSGAGFDWYVREDGGGGGMAAYC